jgi:hypothetical protein
MLSFSFLLRFEEDGRTVLLHGFLEAVAGRRRTIRGDP